MSRVTIPAHHGPSTFFFFADVEPKETMSFGVTEGLPLNDDETVEVFGHALTYWTILQQPRDFLELHASVDDLFAVTLALYALLRLSHGDARGAIPKRATIHSWLELRDVDARANIVGTLHERYHAHGLEVGGERARDFRLAATGADRSRRDARLRVAFKDYHLSLEQRGDDRFLYAYRALESIRRYYVPGKATAESWKTLHRRVGLSEDLLEPLTAAATDMRHGDTDGEGIRNARKSPEGLHRMVEGALMRFLRAEQLLPAE